MEYKSGYGFPRDVFFDEERLKRLYHKKWFFVGTRADVPKVRSTFRFSVLDEEYFLVHGGDGIIRCFVNRCAHQSARLVHENAGKCGARIICPNHQWAFDISSGALVHATGMPEDFPDCAEGQAVHLDQVALREVDGLLLACLGEAPESSDIDVIKGLVSPYTHPFGLGQGGYKVAYHEREIIDASWLSAMINNRECNHCTHNHKRLLSLFHPTSFNGTMTAKYDAILKAAQARWDKKGLAWKEQAFTVSNDCRVARYPLGEGHKSLTFDGSPACSKLIGPYEDGEYDECTLSVWFNPNSWTHFASDHIAANWVLPLSSERCAFYTSWIVRADAVEGVDYTKEHLTEVWKVTNAEDIALVKSMSEGTKSSHYRPGPYSTDEKFCTQFSDWYMQNSEAAL